VSHACAAVKKRIDQEIECGATDDEVSFIVLLIKIIIII